jgi:hypothetical protein
VRIEAAREMPLPSTDVLVARTTASASTPAYKEQIHAAVAGAADSHPDPSGSNSPSSSAPEGTG